MTTSFSQLLLLLIVLILIFGDLPKIIDKLKKIIKKK